LNQRIGAWRLIRETFGGGERWIGGGVVLLTNGAGGL